MLPNLQHQLRNHLDPNGRLKLWPSKGSLKEAAVQYLATKFELDKEYTEPEVNAVLNEWHTFGDQAILRRELVDRNFLHRQLNGGLYWRGKDAPMFN